MRANGSAVGTDHNFISVPFPCDLNYLVGGATSCYQVANVGVLAFDLQTFTGLFATICGLLPMFRSSTIFRTRALLIFYHA